MCPFFPQKKDVKPNSYIVRANIWNRSYPAGGNYWSGYTSGDLHSGPYQNETGSDGIANLPYIMGGGPNVDRYPLVTPYISIDLNGDGIVNIHDLFIDGRFDVISLLFRSIMTMPLFN